MKLVAECKACLLSKVRTQAANVISNQAKIKSLIDTCERIFDEGYERQEGATVTSGRIHRLCYATANVTDLYLEIKDTDNQRAKDVLERVNPFISNLHDAMTAAVIGNAMDYGVTGHAVAENFTDFFLQKFHQGLALDDSVAFFPLIQNVVYFTDNCGELIFDIRFIQELKKNGSHVTVIVKDGPMLNDVTMREAELCGLKEVADAVYTGGGDQQLGTHPCYFSRKVQDAVEKATLLISKGLANYESLTEYRLGKPIAYLMMIKCDVIRDHISKKIGTSIKKGQLIAILEKEN